MNRWLRDRRPRRSIRLRLTLVYGLLFLTSGAAVLGITYALVHRTAADIFMTTKGPNGGTASVIIGSTKGNGPTLKAAVAQTIGGAPAPGFESGPVTGAVRGPSGKAQIEQTAQQLKSQAVRQRRQELHQLLFDSGIALAAMAIVSVVLGWIVAGRVLRPLRTITAKARDISATNLHERLALDGPADELKELGDTFDELLARLESSFRAQRQFVANASHELRTPLARQRALVQVALSDPEADLATLRAAHERVLVSGARQERLIEAMLTLTRGQSGLERRETFDLATVTELALLGRDGDALQYGVTVHSTLLAARTSGDARLVERLVTNLVDNAIRHNAPGGTVQVLTGDRDGEAIVSVVNTGPVVPPDAVDRLLQPFQRLVPTRTGGGDGIGLGLSIVAAIAAAHGATLEVRARAGGGLAVEVRFQSARATAPAAGDRAANRTEALAAAT